MLFNQKTIIACSPKSHHSLLTGQMFTDYKCGLGPKTLNSSIKCLCLLLLLVVLTQCMEFPPLRANAI